MVKVVKGNVCTVKLKLRRVRERCAEIKQRGEKARKRCDDENVYMKRNPSQQQTHMAMGQIKRAQNEGKATMAQNKIKKAM